MRAFAHLAGAAARTGRAAVVSSISCRSAGPALGRFQKSAMVRSNGLHTTAIVHSAQPTRTEPVQAWLFQVRPLAPTDTSDDHEGSRSEEDSTALATSAADSVANDESDDERVYIQRDDFEFARAGITLLPATLFAMPPRTDLLHRAVVWQRREWWQGTSKVKVRGEVRGGGKKPWRQKGTGRARHGSIRSPIFRGGGVIHGPKPRDHSIKLPAKVQRLAIRAALSIKYAQGDLYIVDDLDIPGWKTRMAVPALEEQGWDTKTLFVGTGPNEHFERAVGNLPTVDYIDAADISVYHMLLRHSLVLTRSAVADLEARLVPVVQRPRLVNNPEYDVTYVKPPYKPSTKSKQSQRPAFLPRQRTKKSPKRVIRVYTSPRKWGGRKYIDRKYANVGGAAAKYLGNVSDPYEEDSEEDCEEDDVWEDEPSR
eukprot:m.66886 g.66886  ORF g.66886 m.66886 type:complete len:426 (-) comp8396_c1_seq1:371-1648(-)